MANRHADAIVPYRRAPTLDPALPQLRNNLAGALTLTDGDLNEQLSLLEAAVRDAHEDGNAWINPANAYRRNLDLPRALEAGAMAIRHAPNCALAYNNYALTLREAQRWDDAEQAATTALRTRTAEPDNVLEARHAATRVVDTPKGGRRTRHAGTARRNSAATFP